MNFSCINANRVILCIVSSMLPAFCSLCSLARVVEGLYLVPKECYAHISTFKGKVLIVEDTGSITQSLDLDSLKQQWSFVTRRRSSFPCLSKRIISFFFLGRWSVCVLTIFLMNIWIRLCLKVGVIWFFMGLVCWLYSKQ